jgi:hypothetical protein
MLPRRRLLAASAAALALPAIGRGQLAEPAAGTVAPRLGDMRLQRYRVGVTVTAEGGPCRGLYATLPVPAAWPEQKVRIVEEDISRGVKGPAYRTLAEGVEQMVVTIPSIPAGGKEQAIVTFELERFAIVAPDDTAGWRIPAKPDRALRVHLGASPYVETRDPKIVKFAKQAAGDHEGWKRVEAIYDAVRDKVEYRNGELKGARRALADGWGDCEELTCLFIAAARSQDIPARTVWVEGHCYPEFYLEDAAGNGCWHPCQAAGTRAFGSMPDQLPILQKGDSFRDPDRPGKQLRYVAEFLKGSAIEGGGKPLVTWVREGA